MPEKATVEIVVVVDANGDYGIGKDLASAAENYANDIGDLADAGGYRVVNVAIGVPLPEAVALTGDAPPWSGAATLAVAG